MAPGFKVRSPRRLVAVVVPALDKYRVGNPSSSNQATTLPCQLCIAKPRKAHATREGSVFSYA